jgi:hypothetical protein
MATLGPGCSTGWPEAGAVPCGPKGPRAIAVTWRRLTMTCVLSTPYGGVSLGSVHASAASEPPHLAAFGSDRPAPHGVPGSVVGGE